MLPEDKAMDIFIDVLWHRSNGDDNSAMSVLNAVQLEYYSTVCPI